MDGTHGWEHHWDCPVTVGSPGARQVQADWCNPPRIHVCFYQGQHELFQVVTCVTTTANLSIHDSLVIQVNHAISPGSFPLEILNLLAGSTIS